ncbi:MAG TPA: hypothetical protein VN181_01320 [Thermoanaerobaculia bacterium]|nr:hypothetical protein [Thermoanaerobaculia bacterium]
MKTKLILGAIAVLTLTNCRGGSAAQRTQKEYEVVQEGAANGVTSTINAPGETTPPLTGTNADTTTAFALPTTQTTLPPNSGGAGTYMPAYPPAYPTPSPATAPPPQAQQPRVVTPQPQPTPQPVPQPEPQPLPPPTETAATTTTPPPPPTDTAEQEQEEPDEEPPTQTDTSTTTAPPPL